MVIEEEFNKIKNMIAPILVDFNKYVEFLAIKEDEGVEYREFNLNGIDYVEVTLFHEEEPPQEEGEEEDSEEEVEPIKVIDEVYTIIAFTDTTLAYYRAIIEESKATVSALDILGEELTNKQKNYLIVAIAFETILDYLKEVLHPSEEKDFLETMKELVDGVQL